MEFSRIVLISPAVPSSHHMKLIPISERESERQSASGRSHIGPTGRWRCSLVLLALLGGLLAQPAVQAAETVTITEFLAGNVGGLLDEDGDSSDWIELYNSGTNAVNLFGWFLTDETNNPAKWTFPAVTLGAKEFLIVFASGKDRATNGAPLHANFSLDPDGDYLALVHPDGVTIASEFAPQFPPQRANFSYGVGQSIVLNRLVASNAPVKVLVPANGALGLSWVSNTFNDAGWITGTNGVGYETSVPGFAARNFKATIQVGSLAAAEGVITNAAQQSAVYGENTATINYVNTGAGAHYGSDRTFPGLTINVDVEDFVLEATGTITVPAPGQWSFGVNSDDGFRLTIGNFAPIFYDPPRGPGDTLGTINFPAAGDYPLRLVFYERGGGSEVELFAAQGNFAAWGSNFKLIGDVANGGLAVRSLPIAGGGSLGYRSLIRTDVQSQMLNKNASAFIRIPLLVTSAAALETLRLQINYDDGFVAYLNGTEVARRNAPAAPAWNSTATAAHLGLVAEDINLYDYRNLLLDGNNMLAIQGLNDATNGVDFFVAAELVEYRVVPSTNSYFSTPTPGAYNTGAGFAGFVGDTKFSHDRGFYETNFSLVITTATAGATIRYTLNGTVPSLTNGFTYSSPILITNTATLRAAAFKTGVVPSDVDTETYIFVNDVIRQSPTGLVPGPGWPAPPSVNSQVIDYGMDPDIVNHPVWGAEIKDDLKAIPSFSIVTDLKNLFDSATGIYANPSGDEITWERPGSLELIFADGTKGFQINCGIRIRGGFSRSGSNPKHAFRFFFRQDYGAAKLNYPLFGDQGTDTFDKFDLRTMQNYSWAFQNDGRMVCVRDTFSRETQRDMGQPYTRGDFYHLYINGQYWGLYNIEERSEASFGETYFGGRAEDYDTIKVDPDLGYNIEATDGNSDAWFRLWRAATNGFASDVDYFKIQGLNVDGTPNPAYENLLDVDDLIDYMLVILYGGNLDAPISNFLGNTGPNNWFGVRNRTGAFGGFRFFAHDSEHTLLNVNEDRTGLVDGQIGAINPSWTAGNPITGGGTGAFSKSSPQYIWFRLVLNAEFRLRVADHVQKHFFNGGALSVEGARARFLSHSNDLYRAIVCESARWGDAKRATPFTRTDWINAMNTVNNQFLPTRTSVLLNQLKADSLYPNTTVAPVFNRFGGLVPAGFNVYLTNLNASGTIYYTLDGFDPRARGGNVSTHALAYTPGTPITINVYTLVRARVQVGSTWSAIVEPAYYPSQDFSKLWVTEIMYNPPAAGLVVGDEYEFLELKNAGTNTLDLSGVYFSEGINFTFTNGTRLGPGQFFVLGRNAAQLTNKYPGLVVNGVYTGKLDNGGETITLSHPLGSQILSFGYKDTGRWPITPDGQGFSLVPLYPNANPGPGNPSNWRASTLAGGSPGADDPPPTVPHILVNEALTHTDFPVLDSVELYNPTVADVDIGGWFLTDDPNVPKKFRIPANTVLTAGGFVIFTEADYNPTPGTNNSFALDSHGDQIYLLSADANTNLTGYSHGFNFGAAQNGVTFGRYIISTGDEHFVAQISNTLGSANSGPRVGPVVINTIMYHPPDLPGGVDDQTNEFVEVYNITGAAVPLYDPLNHTNTWQLRGGVNFDFPTNVSLAAGASLLVVGFDPANAAQLTAFRSRYPLLAAVPVFGPWTGKLDNSSETVSLKRPDTPDPGFVPYLLVDQVDYKDVPPWPVAADGGGAALKRIEPLAYGNDPVNWQAVPPLTITANPQGATVRLPANVTFIVAAYGSGALTFQWLFNGSNIVGATNAILTITNPQLENSGIYSVVVTDDVGSGTSQSATLVVLAVPLIRLEPLSQTVAVGSNVTLTAGAYGTLPMSFRWRKGSVNLTNTIVNSTNSSYTFLNIRTNDAGFYNAAITNLAGPAARLTSNAYVTVVIPPTNQIAEPGTNVTFNVQAFGAAPTRYQWQYNGTNVTGATNASLNLSNVQPADAGTYAVVVSVVTNAPVAPASFGAQLIINMMDSDGDGLPDDWEIAHGLNPNDPNDAALDSDGDGLLNWQEYVAGTDPHAAQSVLELTATPMSGSGNDAVVLNFEAMPNKSYTVQCRATLATNEVWSVVTNIAAAAGQRTVQVTNQLPAGTPQRFYRLQTPALP